MIIPTQINRIKFAAGLLLTGILSLSVHAIMLQNLHVPFPDVSVIDKPYVFILRVCSALGLLYFCELASEKVSGSYVKKWVLLFLIDAMLTESLFRSPFMDGYCTNSILFMFVNNVPKLFSIAVVCGLVVLATLLRMNRAWKKIIAALVITAISIFVAKPLFGAAWSPVMSFMDRFAPKSEWCKLPYGPDILIPAYISYIEPVVACSVMALLVWHQLSKIRWMQYLLFTLMVLAIKNQLLTPVFYGLFGKSSFAANLLSEMQFVLEAMVLAMLTGFTILYSSKGALKVR